MGMVVIQPYILVSKLKKIKTKFLRCTSYLNSIKPYKARFIANSSSCTTTDSRGARDSKIGKKWPESSRILDYILC